MTKETCPIKNCPYQAIEYLSGGYGMPVREKPYCILEKQNKPCEKVEGSGEEEVPMQCHDGVGVHALPSSTKALEDIEDIPNDSYGGSKEVGA